MSQSRRTGSLALPYKQTATLTGHSSAVLVVKLNPDGQYCLSGSQDKSIKLWNPWKGTLIKTYMGHGWEVLDIDISHDNTQFASVGGDRSVYVWDVSGGSVLRKFSGHHNRINAVAFSEDANVLASGSYDSTVRLWDLRSSSRFPIQILEEAKDSISSLEIHSTEILAGSVDGHVRNYDIRMGYIHDDNITYPVTSARFSGDRQCVLVGSLDNTLRLLDKDSGELLCDYRGHRNSTYKIGSCLDNTDAYVVSGSEDNTIYFWDLVEGKVVHSLKGHHNVVTQVAYHPKEVKMVSASVDKTIQVWQG